MKSSDKIKLVEKVNIIPEDDQMQKFWTKFF